MQPFAAAAADPEATLDRLALALACELRPETDVDGAWHTAAVRGSFSALLGDEDDLDGPAGDHGVVVDSVRVSVLL